MPARLAHGNTSFEVIVKDKRRRECQHTRTSVPGNNLSIQRLREGSSSNPLRRCTGLGREFSLVVSYVRKLKAICSQWGAVQGHIYHSVISLVKETLRQRWGEEKTKISREASLSKVIQSLTHCCFCHLFCLVRCWRWLRQTKDPRKEPNSWTYPPLSVVTVGLSD